MPKKKTGQRKKAEKQKLRQKEIRNTVKPLADVPCNAAMEVIHSLSDFMNIEHFLFRLISSSAISVNESKNLVPFVIFAKAFNVFRCVLNAVKWNACWKQAIVLLNMLVYLQRGLVWSVQYVTFVKRG